MSFKYLVAYPNQILVTEKNDRVKLNEFKLV